MRAHIPMPCAQLSRLVPVRSRLNTSVCSPTISSRDSARASSNCQSKLGKLSIISWRNYRTDFREITSARSSPGDLALCFFRRLDEKGLTAIFQIKTFTAVRLFEQAFHFLRSRDQIVHFGDL